jgi:hypothetical protein
VGDEVAIVESGHLIKGPRLQDAAQRPVFFEWDTELDVAPIAAQRNANCAKLAAIAFEGGE